MKRGWTKFWLCISLLAAPPGIRMGLSRAIPAPHMQNPAHRANETLLAGLRPGRDAFAVAEKRFRSKNLTQDAESRVAEWRDACSGRAIRLGMDTKAVIQRITITMLGSKDGPCLERQAEFLQPNNWVTGHGLRIGESQDRITDLYGEPNSSKHESKDGHELDLLVYKFDWAGSDVPQAMEILCARETGRVNEISLSFSSPTPREIPQ